MKNTILIASILVLMAGVVLTSCQSSSKKIKNAQENLDDANAKTAQANLELEKAIADSVQKFKEESNKEISSNEAIILSIKEKIAKDNKANKAKYEKVIADIEKRNNEMKKDLSEYNSNKKEEWQEFKVEFKRDMKELKTAINDLSVNNTK